MTEKTMIHHLSPEKQIEEIKAWFYSKYEDPVENCPHETREGGYQFIWGGPYDTREEIEGEFGDKISESIINQVVSELEEQCTEWSGHPN